MIKDFELKLSGKLPINREELFTLVDSWGRKESILTDEDIIINNCDANEKYDLSNLDVSQITDLSYVFAYSPYNGDLSKWDISNVKNMNRMFSYSKFHNDSISNWNVYNVENMEFMFYKSRFNSKILNWDISHVKKLSYIFGLSEFDGDISSWNINNDVECFSMFQSNVAFRTKYNNGEEIFSSSKNILKWFEDNKEKMKEINTPKEKILDFFSFESNKELDK